jgi:hypothetical protein
MAFSALRQPFGLFEFVASSMKQRAALTVADRSMMTWPFYDVYMQCVIAKQPQAVEIRTRNRLKLPVHVQGRVWPLSDNDDSVTALLGAAMYFAPLEAVST